MRNLDFEKEEVGLETVKDLEKKQVLDAFTCVECGRCQMNCPAYRTGKALNPKKLILENEDALLAGKMDAQLVDVYDPDVLWQCTTCGACENQCPVGIEHLPLIIGARRGLVSNGEAPDALGAMYNQLERRGNIWGLRGDQRQKFVTAAGLETFDASKHEYLMWLGCAGSYDADFQKSLRSLFDVLRSRGVTFGVLAKERCTGDPAKRTGNEYMFQELAHANIEEFQRGGREEDPDGLPALCQDDRRGLSSTSASRPRWSTRPCCCRSITGDVASRRPRTSRSTTRATWPGTPATSTSRARCSGGSAPNVKEPVRNRENPFCCGAGGGLALRGARGRQADQPGALRAAAGDRRGHDHHRLPVLLDHAQGRAGERNATTQVVDLMTYVDGRLRGAAQPPVSPEPRRRAARAKGLPRRSQRGTRSWRRRADLLT